MAQTIRLGNLSIGYRGRKGISTVARDISATIHGGCLTCLIGQNGAGKSTLLRTVAGFQPLLGGTVEICGRDISGYTRKELSRTVSVVLTERPDVTNMTVREMVCLGRSPYTGFWGTFSDEDAAAADEAIGMVGIAPLSTRRIRTLSDGERQKAMIAKALAQQTPVILLDEPTAFLDFPSKVGMMRLLHRISRETGKIVFLSTHDLDLALQIADTLWLMAPGGRIATGTPEDLALDGVLPAFFSHEGMVFDTATGLFLADVPQTATAGVTGIHGIRRSMLCKALRRCGITPSDSLRPDCNIEICDDAFIVRKGGMEIHAGTVGGVISAVCGRRAGV